MTFQARLRLLGLGSATACVALISLLFLSPLRDRVAVPGELTTVHAPLTERCEACHALAADAVQGLWHGVAPTALDRAQSEKCTQCHGLGSDPLRPHGWSPEALDAHAVAPADLEDAAALPQGPLAPLGLDGRIDCATCHREHRGRAAELAALTDERCQACHARRFGGLTDGHPELGAFPYERRTRLVFDHAAHIQRYFPGDDAERAPAACTACHASDPSGRHMTVAGYETACAACHEEEIRGATQVGSAGIPFLSLPALDTLTLSERGIGIGRWPSDSMLTETGLTPFLQLLLSAHAETRADLALLEGTDLLDLTGAGDDDLAAVGRVAWELKELLAELSTGGHRALVERVEAALGRPLDADTAGAVLACLPEDLVGATLSAWLPDLPAEIAEHAAGRDVPTDAEPAEADLARDRAREAWVASGGWYREDMDFLVSYRPGGHADPFLRAWLDLAASAGAGSALLDALSAPGAPGACGRCHSVDETGGGATVNWTAGPPRGEDLTRFSHVEHFASPADNACLTCHELAGDPDRYGASFEQRDPARFEPGFAPIPIETCTRCHGPRGAPDACTTCHVYHSERPRESAPRAALDALHPDAAAD